MNFLQNVRINKNTEHIINILKIAHATNQNVEFKHFGTSDEVDNYFQVFVSGETKVFK